MPNADSLLAWGGIRGDQTSGAKLRAFWPEIVAQRRLRLAAGRVYQLVGIAVDHHWRNRHRLQRAVRSGALRAAAIWWATPGGYQQRSHTMHATGDRADIRTGSHA